MPTAHQILFPAILTAALLGAEANAQQAPSTPDKTRLAAARRVLETSGAVDAMVAAIRANLPAQRQAMPQVPAEFWTRFEARIEREAPQLVDSIALLYAHTFTQGELEALVAFYASPVGRRFRAVQPTLVSESSAIGQRWGSKIGAEVGASLEPE